MDKRPFRMPIPLHRRKQPQNPPRNMNWAGEGRWVHWAKIAFEKYFMRKVRKGQTEPFFERTIMGMTKVTRLK